MKFEMCISFLELSLTFMSKKHVLCVHVIPELESLACSFLVILVVYINFSIYLQTDATYSANMVIFRLVKVL